MSVKLSNFKISIKNYLFVMKTAFISAKSMFFALIGFTVIKVGIPPVSLYLGKRILDEFVSLEGKSSDVIIIIALIAGLGLFTSFLNSIQRCFNALIGQLVTNHLTKVILEKAIQLDLKYFDTASFYKHQKNVERALNGRWEFQIFNSIDTVSSLVSLIIMMGIVSALNIWLGVITIVGVIPSIFVGLYTRDRQFNIFSRQIPELRKIDYIKNVLVNPDFAKEVKLFQIGGYFMDKYNKFFGIMYNQRKKMHFSIIIREFGANILSTCSMGACQLYIALKTFNKVISVGDYSLYYGAVQSIASNLGQALNIIATSYEQILLADVLVEYINLKPGIEVGEGEKVDRENGIPVMEFKDVSFKYPDVEHYALKNLNFKVEPGEKMAIVGLNGAGKTTIVKLMTRLYDVTDGNVLVNEKDIRLYKPEEIYELYSAVFQDYAKYGLSVKENIAIGNLKELENKEKYEIAAKEVGLADTIDKIPGKYDSYLSKLYDMSGFPNLSVGEWQKLSIARAFFRPASIYILDEPTASLDPMIEHEIFKQFLKLSERKTAVLITHRLSSVRMVDKIIFLEGGKIIESGSHDELIKSGGKYADLFNLQASKYKDKEAPGMFKLSPGNGPMIKQNIDFSNVPIQKNMILKDIK